MTADPSATAPTLMQYVLSSASTSKPIPSQTILSTSDTTLFRLLPLILSTLQHRGENVETQNDRATFIQTVEALHTRICARRSLKLRFLLFLRHPAFSSYWKYDPVYHSRAYAFASHALRRRSEPEVPKPIPLALLLNDSSALITFAASIVFSPEGVRTRAIPHLGVIAHCAFYGSEVIDIIINQEGVADRRTAIEIAQELLTLGVIHSIEPQVRTVVDDRKAIYQCRHARLRDDGAVELDGDDEVHMRVGWVHMTMAMDMEDLQSLDFWTKLVYVKQVDKGFRYDIRCVTHPLAGIVPTNGKRLDIINFDSCDAEHEEGIDVENGQIQGTEEDHSNASEALLQADDISTDVSEESNIVQSIVVQTVLPSKTRPMVLGLQKLVEDGSLHKERQYINLAPSILVKPGANLMQDACIQIMFQCFNSIWDSCSVFKETHGGVIPFCASCEVFPTSSSNGFVEVQTGLASMKRFDWRAWRDRYGEHAERVNDMLRSAAGSYIGTYILGGRDRNFDNVLVKDWRYVLHMDFSYVLGRMPPVDVPSISLALDMEKAFREINVWEKFVNMAVDAYIALRQNAGMLKHVAKLLFTKAGYTGEEVSDFLDGKKSLNVQCAEGEAGETIRNLLMKSATDVSQWFQEFNHDTVIPIWFDLIKKGFPPVEMVMSFMDAVEESQATPVVGADEVEIDEDEIVEVM